MNLGTPDRLMAASHVFIGVIFCINMFIVLVFANCLFWETVKANSAGSPENVFQWSRAGECFCETFAEYGEWIGL